MNLGEVWRQLGIARTEDTGAIRRAYAARLKLLDLDRDAEDYARLRVARETALRWAAGRQQARVASPEGALADTPVAEGNVTERAAWPYAAPIVPGGDADPALTVAATAPETDPYLTFGPVLARHGELREVPLPTGDPFAVPPLPSGSGGSGPLIQPDRGRDVAFYNLLFPGGEPSDEALAGTELAAAEGHFRAILRQAQEGDLALSEMTENWLADTLARAWPRSAPFVAEAAEAFAWREQAGLLGERPAVAFLNARLKGMRFHERVLEPDHVLHKAWAELVRPGRAGALHRLRVGRGDVEQLIAGVRKNFPELEHFWDPQRVSSWEGAASGSGSSGPGVWIWVVIFFGAIRLLASLPGSNDRDAVAAPPAAYLDESAPVVREVLDGTARAIFGADADMARVEASDPALARVFKANFPTYPPLTSPFTSLDDRAAARAQYIEKMRNIIRERVYRAGRMTGGDELRNVMKVRLAHLVAARRIGTEACTAALRHRELPAWAALEPGIVVEEQRLASHFLKAGQLNAPASGSQTANVPGQIVDQVLRETGFSAETLDKVMQDKGTDQQRCVLSITLLKAVLRSGGSSQEAILRVL